MTFEDIPGWSYGITELYDDVIVTATSKRESKFVEVGCWLGRSTAYLARLIRESGKPIKLYAVDHGFGSPGGDDYYLHRPFLTAYGGNVFGKFVSNLRDCEVLDGVTPICADSVKAADLFAPLTLDFVFLDGAHDGDSVRRDLETWWPKVAVGGVLAGHDYDGCWPSVVEAVNRFFKVPRSGPGEPPYYELRDRSASCCWSRVKTVDGQTSR